MNYNNQYKHITVKLTSLNLSLIHAFKFKAFNGLQILQR